MQRLDINLLKQGGIKVHLDLLTSSKFKACLHYQGQFILHQVQDLKETIFVFFFNYLESIYSSKEKQIHFILKIFMQYNQAVKIPSC